MTTINIARFFIGVPAIDRSSKDLSIAATLVKNRAIFIVARKFLTFRFSRITVTLGKRVTVIRRGVTVSRVTQIPGSRVSKLTTWNID